MNICRWNLFLMLPLLRTFSKRNRTRFDALPLILSLQIIGNEHLNESNRPLHYKSFTIYSNSPNLLNIFTVDSFLSKFLTFHVDFDGLISFIPILLPYFEVASFSFTICWFHISIDLMEWSLNSLEWCMVDLDETAKYWISRIFL